MKQNHCKAPEKLSELISVTADKAVSLAKEGRLLGEPYTADGVTVIPVSKVSVGLAGGGSEKNGNKNSENPAGVGAKVNVTPTDYIVISNGHARLIALQNNTPAVDIKQIASAVSKLFKKK